METNCNFCNKIFKTQLWKTKKYKNLFCSWDCSVNFKKKQTDLICKICGKSFSVPTIRLSKAKTISCSKECGFESVRRQSQITRACKYCGKDFSFTKSRAKFFKKEFCSLLCSNKCQPRGEKDSNFKHGIGRYREIAFSYYPHLCAHCNKKRKNLDVHHRDHNRSNNKIENLIILCRSCHLTYHKNYIPLSPRRDSFSA
jgi:hypothetical protein